MISDLKLILFQGVSLFEDSKVKPKKATSCGRLKDLVRLLLEDDYDLIVMPNSESENPKLTKIFSSYRVPFLFCGGQEKESNSLHAFYVKQDKDLIHKIQDIAPVLHSYRVERENKKLKFVMHHLMLFTSQVMQTSKDMFIAESKNFFKQTFTLEACHWVEVKNNEANLPPILKLKQQLENQKVDQGALIQELDQCSEEMVSNGDFQIWKNQAGHFLAFLWVVQDAETSQCLVLQNIQIKNRKEVEAFFSQLSAFLKRRWDLCLRVEEAENQVYFDSLTDLYNQRFLLEVVDKKIEEYRRYKTPFSVLFIDVDHFKRVNDSLGHLVGSGVLKLLGTLLKRHIRTSDFAFRYGGDEFIVLLSHTEGADAEFVAERIRKAVENFQFVVNTLEVRITISIGLAFYPRHAQSSEEIIRIADEAMYYGKNKSRNIVYKAS